MPEFFIDQSNYKLLEYGYLAIFKRESVTSAQELELFKAAISTGVSVNQKNVEPTIMYKLKVGHGGTLDKMATGVLALGLFKGCKSLKILLNADKQYRVTARLGIATDSYDSNGNVVDNCSYEHVTRAMIEDKLKSFIGDVLQKPPVYSALKHGGKRVSDIARAKSSRAGEAIEMKPRPVKCYDVQCVDFRPPYFSLEVKCGKGFYVRSLISDLTKELSSCGHVVSLLRTKHGQFTLDDCLQAENYNITSVVAAVQENRIKFPLYANFTSDDVSTPNTGFSTS